MKTREDLTQTDIYRYMDYRRFLKDITGELKARRQFNVRLFAKKSGLKAPGYLKMVIEGKRNLTLDSAHKFCQALELVGKKEQYFEKLVLYNQTPNPDLKKQYLEELIHLLPRSSDFVVGKKEGRYFSRPYYVCIREMVGLKDFREDAHWIAKRCFPPISPSQAREAIQVLLELGLLKRDEKGKLVQAEDFIRTQDKNTDIIEAYHFHEAMIDKARHALGALKQNERNYYALTLPLPKKMFEEIINEFYEWRNKIVNKVAQGIKDFDEVYQINFQFFPLTKRKEEGKSDE